MDAQAQALATIPIEQKKNYLDLLAIGYYVVGALAALVSCFALIYVGLGAFMMASPSAFQPDAPPPFVGCLVFGLGMGFLLLNWSFAGAVIYASRCLAKRQKYNFALVAGVVSCLFTPFGTILRVFTIILLLQPEVKALFEPPAPAPAASQ